MSEITEYQKLIAETNRTKNIFYIIGFCLLIFSVGSLWPLAAILIAIGELYYAPRAAKYEKKVVELQELQSNN